MKVGDVQRDSLDELFEKMRTAFSARLEGSSVVPSSPSQLFAARVVDNLLLLSGQTEGTSLHRFLSKQALEAMDLLCEFTFQVHDVREVLLRKRSQDLKPVKFHRHILETSADHKNKVLKLIALLSTSKRSHPSLRDWKQYVKEGPAQRIVAQFLTSGQYFEEVSLFERQPLKVDRKWKGKMPASAELEMQQMGPPKEQAEEQMQEKKSHVEIHPEDQTAHIPVEELPSMNERFWEMEADHALELWNVSASAGLNNQEVEIRRKYFGNNKLPDPEKPSALKILAKQLLDFMMLILIGACMVSTALGDWKAASTLIVVIVANASIGFYEEWRAEKALSSLYSLTVPQAQVIRNGQRSVISSTELVCGDIVILEEGAAVPADVRLIECTNLQVIEAILTGESQPAFKSVDPVLGNPPEVESRHQESFSHQQPPKHRAGAVQSALGDRTCMGYMSTMCCSGRGVGVVVSTGDRTEVGRISASLGRSRATKVTPLQKKLARVGKILVLASILLCSLVAAIALLRGFSTLATIRISIALAVSVIPEGLVAVVSVTMALSVQRMAKRQVIVRKLEACETLGAVTSICCDKTGTLTEGKMTVSRLFIGGRDYKVNLSSSADIPEGELLRRKSIEESIQGSVAVPLEKQRTEAVPEQQQKQQKMDQEKKTFWQRYGGQFMRRITSKSDLQLDENLDQMEKGRSQAQAEAQRHRDFEKIALDPDSYSQPLKYALLTACLCNTSSVKKDDQEQKYVRIGDPVETAFIFFSMMCKHAKETQCTDLEFVRENPFDTVRKRMSVIYRNKKENKLQVFVKGAPENLVDICSHVILEDSSASSASSSESTIVDMNKDWIDKIDRTGSEMAASGLRVLSLAYKEIPLDSLTEQDHKRLECLIDECDNVEECQRRFECDLTFIALAGLLDPPRKEVKDAIRVARNAGIQVRMITGDHLCTAIAIAKMLGIILEVPPKSQAGGVQSSSEVRELDDIIALTSRNRQQQKQLSANSRSMDMLQSSRIKESQLELYRRSPIVLTGPEIDAMHEDELASLPVFPPVFSRVSPSSKCKIVKALQRRGEIVAMTGDGVNDAESLKSADVGVSMGEGAADIAKEASDIVLINNSFASLIKACEEGRLVYDNVKKFLIYLLSCNSSEIFILLATISIGLPAPFTAISILWLNILADIPPSIALSLEPAEPGIMDRKPRDPNAGLFSSFSIFALAFQAALMTIIPVLSFEFALEQGRKLSDARSLAFAMLASLQLIHALVSRSQRLSIWQFPFFSNPWLLWALALSFSLLIFGIYTPAVSSWLDQEPLSYEDWLLIAAACCIHVAAVELSKIFLRKWQRDAESSKLANRQARKQEGQFFADI